MAKYRVIRAWHGVSVGQVVEMEDIHPSLKPNVVAVVDAGAQVDEAGDLLKRAQAEVDAMRKQAEAEVAQRVSEARDQVQAEAKSIIDNAHEEAERIKADALKQAGELIPATPEAPAKSTKTK